MTAAWLQLDALQANIESASSKSPSDPEPTPPPDPLKPEVKLMVGLDVGQVLMQENAHRVSVPNRDGDLDAERIKNVLAQWKKRYPNKNDVIVNSSAGVKYGALISVYDLLVQSGLPEVGINPN